MKPATHCIELHLRKDAILRLPDAAGVEIACSGGTEWITLDDDPRDFVLEAGERITLHEHRRALISALAATSVRVCATPALAEQARYRQPSALAFEQVLA